MFRIYRIAEWNGCNIPQVQLDIPKDSATPYFRDWVRTSKPGKYVLMTGKDTIILTEVKN